MKVSKSGIYRIIGERFELLANIEGVAPLLVITSAILINDLVNYGKFTVLNPKSMELAEVLNSPEKFIFFEYEYSEDVCLPNYRIYKKESGKLPEITDEEYKEFCDKFIIDYTSGRGIAATKYWIIQQKPWSLTQAHILCLKIANQLKREGKIV